MDAETWSTTPVLVIRETALQWNIDLMARYCALQGIDIAPHIKTTMSPEIVHRQLDAGAWGVTVATAQQFEVAATLGAQRIVIGTEIVHTNGIDAIADGLNANGDLRCLLFADSVRGIELLDHRMSQVLERDSVEVLIEIGIEDGRTGCRSTNEVLDVAQGVAAASHLRLSGIAGFEGTLAADRSAESIDVVDNYLRTMVDAASLVDAADLFGSDEVLLSAGGSMFFDRAADILRQFESAHHSFRTVVRSGCYVVHDHGVCSRGSPFLAAADGDFQPALEVWGTVISVPEPNLALIDVGRRDVGFDAGLPRLLAAWNVDAERRSLEDADLEIVALNDQHGYVRGADVSMFSVGDAVSCGISHPCTTMDKWRSAVVVDDDYRIVGSVTTRFE